MLLTGKCMPLAPMETRSLLLQPPPPLRLLLRVLIHEHTLQASSTCQLTFTLRHSAAVSHSKSCISSIFCGCSAVQEDSETRAERVWATLSRMPM